MFSYAMHFRLRKRKENQKMNEIIENRKKSEILAERLNELNYGDFISHEQIASIIEEDYPSNKYSTTIAKTKKILLKKYNKTIENISGDGYRLTNPVSYPVQAHMQAYHSLFPFH